MVDRYCSVDDIKSHLELVEITAETTPTLTQVQEWITSSEEEIDSHIQSKFNVGSYVERFRPDSTTRTIYPHHKPIQSVTKLSQNLGDEWSPVWNDIGTADYRLVTNHAGRTSHIRTKYYLSEGMEMKLEYSAGWTTIPAPVKELCILLTERRMLHSKLAVGAQETETVSIATLRLQDKSRSSTEYKIGVLDVRIQDLFNRIAKGFYKKNYNFGMVWI